MDRRRRQAADGDDAGKPLSSSLKDCARDVATPPPPLLLLLRPLAAPDPAAAEGRGLSSAPTIKTWTNAGSGVRPFPAECAAWITADPQILPSPFSLVAPLLAEIRSARL